MPLYIVNNDIVTMNCDAIVNTTNKDMLGTGGLDEVIHLAAGEDLDKECEKLAPLELGSAKITGAYNLNCKYIIHTSGPTWLGGTYNEESILKSCYLSSLKLAVNNSLETLAFPLISSGTYGYPKDKVLKHAVGVISEFLETNELTVYICVYDRESYEFSKELYSELMTFIDKGLNDYSKINNSKRLSSSRSRSNTPWIRKREKANILEMNVNMLEINLFEDKMEDNLEDFLKNMDETFSTKLLRLIDENGMTDVECYKKANVDKRVFSKIRSNKNYKPSKTTAVAFAISLKLSWNEAKDFLSTAGLAFSHSNAFDMIIEYFIKKGKYNIFEINEALFEFKQPLLGSL